MVKPINIRSRLTWKIHDPTIVGFHRGARPAWHAGAGSRSLRSWPPGESASHWVRSPKREQIGQIGTNTAGADPPVPHRRRPVQPAGGQQHPGDPIGLHHVRRGAPGVSRTRDDLHSRIWWDAYLHRSSGGPLGQVGKKYPHRVAQHCPFGRLTGIERRQHRQHGCGFSVRRGHVGTIRPRLAAIVVAPGSRRSSFTRHSGRRCNSYGGCSLRSSRAGEIGRERRWT